MSGEHAGFLTPGRVVLYLFALVVAAGVAVTYYLKREEMPQGPAPTKRALAGYLSGEHARAWADEKDIAARFVEADYAALPKRYENWLGQQLELPGLPGAGLVFKGGGKSDVPGPRSSAHLRFETPDGQHVSLFLQGYLAAPELEDGKAYRLKGDKALGAEAPPIVVYRRGGLVYYIASQSQGPVDLVRTGIGAPEPSADF